MTLPALATLEQFAARLPGGVSEDDETRAQAALEDASALIRSAAGGTTWTTTNDADEVVLADNLPDVIVMICIAAARRAYVNPEGIRAESPGGYSVTYADSSADIYLTREERRRVRAAAGRNGLGVIPLSRGPVETSTYVDVVGSDKPLPVDLPGRVDDPLT